jgi:subtilisin family serine protease
VAALLGTLVVPAMGPVDAEQAPAPVQHLGVNRGRPSPEIVPDSVLITRTPGVAAASLTWTLATRGLRLRQPVDAAGVGVVDTGGRPVADVVADLHGDPSVTAVSPNYVRRASGTPDDPLYTPYQRQYAGAVRLPAAWDRTIGSRYVEIAVLDTGIDLDHPDLKAKLLPGWDAVNGDSVPADDNGHGTFVAGVAAGRTDNGTGTAGVAWRSRIIPVKVLASNGSGTDADVVEGIQWAVAHGADVINLSLGGEGRSAAIDQWVDYALDHDVAVVAAAGNDGVDTPNYPAASPGVVSVGATDRTGQLAHFSNWGDTVDLVAPGMDIASTRNGGGYAVGDGTSFACPLTAGVVALLRAVEPDLPARDALNRVVNSSKDIAGQGRDPQTGRGLLDAAATVGAKPRLGVAVPGRDALEADGTPDTATPLAATPLSASILPEGDVDWFSVEVPLGEAPVTLVFTVTPPSAGDGSRARELDPVLVAYGPSLDEIGRADATRAGQTESLQVNAAVDGTYRLAVSNWFATAGPGPYTVAVATGPAVPGPQPSPEPPLADVWVRDTAPADFATGMPAGTAITVTMSRDLDPDSVVGGQTVRLLGATMSREIAATVSYDVDTKKIIVVPSSPLRAGLPYLIRLRNVADVDGNVLTDLHRFRFTTA